MMIAKSKGSNLLAMFFICIMLKHESSSLWTEVQIMEEEKEHLFSSPITTAANKGHFAVIFLSDSIPH